MDRETFLLHQVHAGKLAADVTGDVLSTTLMWQRRPLIAVVAGFAPAVLGSAAATRVDLAPLRRTRRGQYVLEHMPAAAQATRMAGQLLAWRAAYQHHAAGVAVGHAVVAAGWSSGLLPHRRRASRNVNAKGMLRHRRDQQIDDHQNRGRNMDTRTPQRSLAFVS